MYEYRKFRNTVKSRNTLKINMSRKGTLFVLSNWKKVSIRGNLGLCIMNFCVFLLLVGCSYDGIYLGFDEEEERCRSDCEESASPQAPLAHMSDICAWSTTGTSTSAEITCVICQEVELWNAEFFWTINIMCQCFSW